MSEIHPAHRIEVPNIEYLPGYVEKIDGLVDWGKDLKFCSPTADAYYCVLRAHVELDAVNVDGAIVHGVEEYPAQELLEVSRQPAPNKRRITRADLPPLLKVWERIDFASERTQTSYERLIERLGQDFNKKTGQLVLAEAAELEVEPRTTVDVVIYAEDNNVEIKGKEGQGSIEFPIASHSSAKDFYVETRPKILELFQNDPELEMTALELSEHFEKRSMTNKKNPAILLVSWLDKFVLPPDSEKSTQDEEPHQVKLFERDEVTGPTTRIRMAPGYRLKIELRPKLAANGQHGEHKFPVGFRLTPSDLYMAADHLHDIRGLNEKLAESGLKPLAHRVLDAMGVYRPEDYDDRRIRDVMVSVNQLCGLLTTPYAVNQFLQELGDSPAHPLRPFANFIEQFSEPGNAFRLSQILRGLNLR